MSTSDIDIIEIIKTLPHRYPFLLVDRVLEMVPGESIKAIKNVTFNEEFFQGHFPGQPVMPGVLIIEAMAQAGGIMAYKAQPQAKGRLIYFMAIDKVKFRQPVVPGDQLVFELKTTHKSSRAWKMSGRAYVDGKVVSQAELTAAVGV